MTDVSLSPSGLPAVDRQWGGLATGGAYLLVGRAGAGRSALALQTARAAVDAGDRVLVISPRPPDALVEVGHEVGLDLAASHQAGHLRLLRIPSAADLAARGAEGLTKSYRDLVGLVASDRPARVVVEDFTPLVQFDTFDRFRDAFDGLTGALREQGVTLVIGLGEPGNDASRRLLEVVTGLIDGTIRLDVHGDLTLERSDASAPERDGASVEAAPAPPASASPVSAPPASAPPEPAPPASAASASPPSSPPAEGAPPIAAPLHPDSPPSAPEETPTPEPNGEADAPPSSEPTPPLAAPLAESDADAAESESQEAAPTPTPPQDTAPAAEEEPIDPFALAPEVGDGFSTTFSASGPTPSPDHAPPPPSQEETPTSAVPPSAPDPGVPPPTDVIPPPAPDPSLLAPTSDPFGIDPADAILDQGYLADSSAGHGQPPPPAPQPPAQAHEIPAAPPPPPAFQTSESLPSFAPLASGPPDSAAAFRTALDAAFDERASGRPFVVVALRMEPSAAEAAHFGTVASALQASLRPNDHILVDPSRKRAIVLLPDAGPDAGQSLFAGLQSHLVSTIGNDAERVRQAIGAVTVPNGQPFQTPADLMAYAYEG